MRNVGWMENGNLEVLSVLVTEGDGEQAFKNHLRTAAQYTDVFWEQVRTSLVKKGAANVRKQEDVTILGGATLPPNIKSALNHGPKFSQEPRLCPVTKLSLVRWIGGFSVPEHQERCVADGVDVLQRTAGQINEKLQV
ncbi:hypothetical protein HPB47_018961 [Ixodes persulcatus]|uniref:Uncharacterized protein n=1 Tax=Ixodes persulcatus TaxID=34615 RepID=A0AC60QJD8_IXOPE|nr:hypothetical protein HPB47_018961 [Ixodes persulcatus]